VDFRYGPLFRLFALLLAPILRINSFWLEPFKAIPTWRSLDRISLSVGKPIPRGNQTNGNFYSLTVIAPVGHWVSQAWQRIQSFSLTGADFGVFGCSSKLCISNTLVGQTATHTAAPAHFPQSTLTFGIKTISLGRRRSEYIRPTCTPIQSSL